MSTCANCDGEVTILDGANGELTTKSDHHGGVEVIHKTCPVPVQSSYSFKYYLHENDDVYGVIDDLVNRAGLPEAIAQKIAEQRAFYEVTFDCVYDVNADEVTIVGTHL